MTQRDGMWREVGGGFRIGNTCTPMADSCWCMAKPIQYCKVKNNNNNNKIKINESYCDFIACQASRNIHEKDRRRFFSPGTAGYILGCMIDIWAREGVRVWWWPRDLLLRVCFRCNDRWSGTICTLCPDLSLDQRYGWLRFDTAYRLQILSAQLIGGLNLALKARKNFFRYLHYFSKSLATFH